MIRHDNQLDKIRDEAADWALHWLHDDRNSGEHSEDHARFIEWLSTDKRNSQEYDRARQAWQIMTETAHLHSTGQTTKKLEANGRFTRLQSWFTAPFVRPAIAFGLLLGLALLWLPRLQTNVEMESQNYVTERGQIKNITLDDGTVVTLGAHSSIQVSFSDQKRQVVLASGDAFFDVSRDPQRPFWVMIKDTQVRVLGTRFDLHNGPKEVRVAVEEGMVEIEHLPAQLPDNPALMVTDTGNTITLKAGEKVTVINNVFSEVQTILPDQLQGWRSGRLEYQSASLAEVVADANRYSKKEISLQGEELGTLPVSTSYQVSQVDKMLKTLQATLPIEIVETPIGVVLKSRD